MSRYLRYENASFPLIRVLYADTFGATGAGPWTEATYWNAAPPEEVGSETSANGIEFDECTRQALPGIGEATLRMEFGTIDGVRVEPIDLLGKHVRIQAARKLADETATPAWRTIWVGRCEWQDDAIDPGAATARGTRTYRCVDLLYAYLRAYPMDRHANYAIPTALSYGHPGYNYDKKAPDTVIGNRESTGSGYAGPDSTLVLYMATSDPSVATTTAWSEFQAVENAMLLRRASGDPIFDLDDPCSLLAEATAMPVQETEMAWEFVNRTCDRRRGKGMAFLDWDDDSASPTGALDVKLRIRPQLADSFTYEYPSGTTNTVTGADTVAEHFVSVDLVGDQRVLGRLVLRDTQDSAVDSLSTESEQIEVAVTVSGDDGTLAERWSQDLEDDWSAADDDEKAEAVYKPVLQYFGLLRSAGVNYKNGDNTGDQRADWWTTAGGALELPAQTVAAPKSIEIMDDLPLYEGYDYSPDVPVPASGASRDGTPRRRKPLVLVRTASGRFLSPKDYLAGGCQVSVDADGAWVEWAADNDGDRPIRSEIDGVDETSLTLSVGLRMPQRVGFQSSVSGTVRRRLTIRVPDLHLWIGHAGCIWDLDGTDVTDDGAAPKRIAGTMNVSGGTAAGKILRDDRAKLARVHYLAWEWYRSDSERKSAQWTIRDCGLLPSWRDLGGSEIPWPKLGQVVTTIAAAGATYTVKTPISRVRYEHRQCTTEWATDWMEFDHGSA